METKFLALAIMTAICFSLLTSSVTAQTQIEVDGNYQFNTNLPTKPTPLNAPKAKANATDHSVKPIIEGRIVKVVEIDNAAGLVYFKYFDFPDAQKNLDFKGANNDLVFFMNLSDFENQVNPSYPILKDIVAGTYVVPFRFRGIGKQTNFDFESSLSLQANIVFGLGRRTKENSWLDLSAGLGLSGINLNSLNSNLTGDEQQSANAVTVSFGGVVKFKQNVNLGVFVGWDWLGAKDEDMDWQYHGKTWLGVGVNVAFTEAKSEDNKAALGKQPKSVD